MNFALIVVATAANAAAISASPPAITTTAQIDAAFAALTTSF